MMNEEYQEEIREEGFPVDLNEQEFMAFHMALAKKMGALRTQTPIMILFAVYLVVDIVTFVKEYIDTGTFSLSLAIIALVTLACAALSMTVVPARIKKNAKAGFLVGNQNGYYGEITVTPYAIMKNIGSETVTIPFSEQTLYVEDKEFMAFTTAGQQRSIVLPARCMTPDMAAQVRQAVFAPNVSIQRRVFARMEARASAPIPRRDFLAAPQTLYLVDFQYTEAELSKLFMDVALKQYFQSLPTVAAMSILAGLLMAILQEQVLWFPCLSLGIIFGYLLITVITAKNRGKKTDAVQNRTHLSLTDQGITLRISPSGQHLNFGWQSVERAVEREAYVEFFHSGGNLLRIPKRAIEDFEEFRRVVDEHFKK